MEGFVVCPVRGRHLLARVVCLAVTGVLTVAAFVLSPGQAQASFGDPVNCKDDPTNPYCVVIVVSPGGGGSGGGSGGSATCTVAGKPVPCYDPEWGWLGSDGCRYKPDPDPPDWLTIPEGKSAEGGAWYIRTCPRIGDQDESVDSVWLDNRDAPVLGTLITQALSRLRLPPPAIRLNPAPPAPQVVHVPTWLWVDRAMWTPRSATASVPGLSVTAVGTPTQVVWSTGDGGRVACGRGSPWRSGMDPAAASPDCGHIYTSPSRVASAGTYPVTATVTWRVSWSGGGVSGVEPALTSTATVRVRVVDSVALNQAADGGTR